MEYIPMSELLVFFGLAIVLTWQYQIQANQDGNQKHKKHSTCLLASWSYGRQDSNETDFR